jgi:hypothetical protein
MQREITLKILELTRCAGTQYNIIYSPGSAAAKQNKYIDLMRFK